MCDTQRIQPTLLGVTELPISVAHSCLAKTDPLKGPNNMLLKTAKFLLARLFFLVTLSFRDMELPIIIINISSIILPSIFTSNISMSVIYFSSTKQTYLNFFFRFLLGSVIVHVMTPQMRNFYKLEKRWKEAEVTKISQSLLPLPHINPQLLINSLELSPLLKHTHTRVFFLKVSP